MGTIIIELMGGLGLFLAGMNMMSHGIEKVAEIGRASCRERV